MVRIKHWQNASPIYFVRFLFQGNDQYDISVLHQNICPAFDSFLPHFSDRGQKVFQQQCVHIWYPCKVSFYQYVLQFQEPTAAPPPYKKPRWGEHRLPLLFSLLWHPAYHKTSSHLHPFGDNSRFLKTRPIYHWNLLSWKNYLFPFLSVFYNLHQNRENGQCQQC